MSLVYISQLPDSPLEQRMDLFQRLIPVSHDPEAIAGILMELTNQSKLPDETLKLLIGYIERTIGVPCTVSQRVERVIADKSSRYKRFLGRIGLHPKRTIEIDVPVNGKHPQNHSSLNNLLTALRNEKGRRKSLLKR
jgi:hypothetical protein